MLIVLDPMFCHNTIHEDHAVALGHRAVERRRLNMKRRIVLAGLASLPLVSLAAPAQTNARPSPGESYFPNSVLRTHEDKPVRFYDDLLKGKIVAINFMYANCEGICPPMTANLVKVQEILGNRVGRDVFMYSISLQPEQDTPADLREYAEMHGVKPGWLFLTGKRDDIEHIRRKLGFYDPDPVIDQDRTQHTGMLRFGNEALHRWAACPALSNPEQIAKSILWMESRKPS